LVIDFFEIFLIFSSFQITLLYFIYSLTPKHFSNLWHLMACSLTLLLANPYNQCNRGGNSNGKWEQIYRTLQVSHIWAHFHATFHCLTLLKAFEWELNETNHDWVRICLWVSIEHVLNAVESVNTFEWVWRQMITI
jgi:hypothetical protein